MGTAVEPTGRQDLRPTGTWLSCCVWGVVFFAASSLLVAAALLTPDPAGHGTHTQLGLPPCGLLLLTGIPCPGCGLTTSYAQMMRLDVAAAARANPFGVALFLVTVLAIPIAAAGAVRNWPVADTLVRLRVELWAMLLALGAVAVWVVRAATILLAL